MIKKIFYNKAIFIISLFLIISMLSVVVYSISTPKSNIIVDNNKLSIEHGNSENVTYTVTPNNLNATDVNDNLKKDIVLVIDTSLTMRSSMDSVVATAKEFVDNFKNSEYIRVGIVEYNGEATVLSNDYRNKPALIDPDSEENYRKLTDAIENLNKGWSDTDSTGSKKHWGTNTGEGIRMAMGLLNQDTTIKNSSKYIIFMSDGTPQAYTGTYPNNVKTYVDSITQSFARTRTYPNNNVKTYDDINLNTFGFGWGRDNKNLLKYKNDNINNRYYASSIIGPEYAYYMGKKMGELGIKNYDIYFVTSKKENKVAQQRETMQKIAENFTGKFLEASDSDKLNSIFQDLATSIDSQYVLDNIKLNLKIPNGVKVKNITCIQNGQEKTIDLNNMTLPNLVYEFDKNKGVYTINPFQIKVEYEGENLTGKDINGDIDGSVSVGSNSLGELPNVSVTIKPGINVNIKVTDFIGQVGDTYESWINTTKDSSGSLNYLFDKPKNLIGNGFANISVKGAQDNENEDYWIKTWFTNDNMDQEISPEEFKLNNMNSDIMINKPNNLTYQSYNVNHLGTMDDEDAWNDRNQVFKSKQGNTGYLPANKVAKNYEQYGTPENLNSTRPIYVGQGKEYELTNTKKVKYVFFDSLHSYLNAEVWTYKRSNNRTDKVYKYGDYWGNLKGGEVKEVSNWMWKPKTIFYDYMRVDDINNDNKYPGFSYKESDKYWGYLKPKESGWYLFGTYSDDGSRFSLTVNNSTYELANSNFGLSSYNNKYFISQDRSNFKVHGTALYTSFQPVYLEANKYYPMQLEYFNWGGYGAFKLGYCKLDNYENNNGVINAFRELNEATVSPNYKEFTNVFYKYNYSFSKYYVTSNIINQYLNNINWLGDEDNELFTMYPSKSNEPGDVANEVFEGKSGVGLPTENGIYTMHYEIFTRAKDGKGDSKILRDNIIKGSYGNFEVKDLLNASIDVTDISGDSNIYVNNNAIVNYRMSPNPLKATDVIRDGSRPPNQISLSNLKISGLLPKGFKFIDNDGSVNGRLESDGSTRIETNRMDDIVYSLQGDQYIAKKVDKKINVKIESIGNFDFIPEQNTVEFTLRYNDKETDNMVEEFKGNNISINEPTKIEKFGILDSSSSDNIKDASEGVQVVNEMPIKVAILADVKSSDSVIDLAFNSNNIKNISSGFKVKVYNKGDLFNSINGFTISKIDNNLISELANGIKISNLGIGEKVIVIELIPYNIKSGESVLLKTAVEKSADKPYVAKLEYADMPDVF